MRLILFALLAVCAASTTGCLTHLASLRISQSGAVNLVDTVLVHSGSDRRLNYDDPTVQARIEAIVRSRTAFATELSRKPIAIGNLTGAVITYDVAAFDTLTIPFYTVRFGSVSTPPKVRLQRTGTEIECTILDRPEDDPAGSTGGSSGMQSSKPTEQIDPSLLGIFADQLQDAYVRFVMDVENSRVAGARVIDANGALLFEFDGARTASDMRDAAVGRRDDPVRDLKLGLYLEPSDTVTFHFKP